MELEAEDVAMGAQALEGPREVGDDWDAECAASCDDAQQHARAVSAFGAACKQHIEAQLSDVLKLALGGRVVDGNHGIFDEVRVSAHRDRQDRNDVIAGIGDVIAGIGARDHQDRTT